MKDPRHDQLARLLVGYSCNVQPGEKVLIESNDTPVEMLEALVEAVHAAGGYPMLEIKHQRLTRAIMANATKESLAVIRDSEVFRMSQMDAFIGIRGPANVKELADLPHEKNRLWGTEIFQPVHGEIRVPKTKWVVLRYPTPVMAMMAGKSTAAFEQWYYDVTVGVDYAKMAEMMDPAIAFLKQADQVHIKGPGTDLRFSIKNIGATKCAGRCNIPDGEVYSCPVRDSVNGVVQYNTGSTYHGFTFQNVRLRFENGKIIEATANDTERVNAIFDADEGARYVGEFALGCNPMIDQAMDEILFDEKIKGSFHFTPGNAYDDTDNGNRSSVHWDLVCIQTPAYGGGEIWMDGQLIREDGLFVHPSFVGLNPDNLLAK